MRALACVALLSAGVVATFAQTTTPTPAPVLQIIRETNKEGRAAAHERVETEWAAAARRANHPARYVGLATISGPSEFWFIEPMASFSMFEDWDKASSKEPVKTTFANLDSRDGELRAASRTYWAIYRPDLSYQPEKFNPGKTRFVTIETMRVRPGRDEDFAAGGKQYLDAMHKANIDECMLAYQVVAGAPEGTYLFFEPMQGMKELDAEGARMQAVAEAMGPENASRFRKAAGEIFTSIDSAILQVKPGMSYPPESTTEADSAFWKPKASAPAAPAAKKTAQH